MLPPPVRFVAAIVIGGVLLIGCARPSMVLWTDIPEMAPIVELFNAQHDDVVVELSYRPDPGRQLRLAGTPPDLVFSAFVADQSAATIFRSLDRLMRRTIDAEEFYAPLLATGRHNGRQYVLPVSFDLPLVYFAGRIPPHDEPMVISPEEIRDRGASFNEYSANRPTRLAYSPLWNTEFLYQYARILGMLVEERPGGEPGLPVGAPLKATAAAREWIADVNGGAQSDSVFSERYLYDPPMQLVRRGRIAYGYGTANHYLSLSDSRRDGIRFRWLGDNRGVRVLENVVYAGIPRDADNVGAAETFLTWFFSPDTQTTLIELALRNRIDSFGLAGGFSSLWRITERVLPATFPELAGKVPAAGELLFPAASPRYWDALVAEVVRPWLEREVRNQPQPRDLDRSIRAWLLQQED